MRRRAEKVDETRQRITDATIRLHTTVGPANTTIASVAAAAGVTRLTVYRHFRDLDELFVACRGDWLRSNPPPDPTGWLAIEDLEARARRGLAEVYGWYAAHGDELYPIQRDLDAMPESTQRAMRAERGALGDALVAGHADASPAGRRLRAAAHLLVSFWTWRSLAVDQGLDADELVDLGTRLLLSAAGASQDRRKRPARDAGAVRSAVARRSAPEETARRSSP